MGRRNDKELYEGLDVILHGIPSKRTLNLSRSEYGSFGTFYRHLRYVRRTWLPESKQRPVSHPIAQIERLVERARLISIPDDIRPIFESMLCLAPALVDHSNGWGRFESEIKRIRERFERERPSPRLFADDEPGRDSFLSRLYKVQKAIWYDSSFWVEERFEKQTLSLLFLFARAVGARKKWKSGLRKWEKGVKGARSLELDSFSWGYRECLMEARYQMVLLGRALEENPNATFNRTKIRNRASIIYIAAHSKEPIVLDSLKKEVKECRRKVNWEAYLNKLPSSLFPKKDCV